MTTGELVTVREGAGREEARELLRTRKIERVIVVDEDLQLRRAPAGLAQPRVDVAGLRGRVRHVPLECGPPPAHDHTPAA